jgi:hypothetical protein
LLVRVLHEQRIERLGREGVFHCCAGPHTDRCLLEEPLEDFGHEHACLNAPMPTVFAIASANLPVDRSYKVRYRSHGPT